ncbi:MAG TPA: hypothetical protein VJQ08_10005, partial [Candidatus Dormibacteraeota bacterium]|nr:hypothetical protein [Candidatus Dormibacteraeota bacterium]
GRHGRGHGVVRRRPLADGRRYRIDRGLTRDQAAAQWGAGEDWSEVYVLPRNNGPGRKRNTDCVRLFPVQLRRCAGAYRRGRSRQEMTAVKKYWTTAALLLLVFAVAAIQLGNPHSYLSEAVSRVGETASGPDAPLTDLTRVDQLQAAFNQDAGRPRLILLLSPT